MVDIWDARTGGFLETLRGHRDGVYGVAFTPDGRGLVSGSSDNTSKYWDVSRLANEPGGRQNSPGTREGISPCKMNFIGHKVRAELAERGCV